MAVNIHPSLAVIQTPVPPTPAIPLKAVFSPRKIAMILTCALRILAIHKQANVFIHQSTVTTKTFAPPTLVLPVSVLLPLKPVTTTILVPRTAVVPEIASTPRRIVPMAYNALKMVALMESVHIHLLLNVPRILTSH